MKPKLEDILKHPLVGKALNAFGEVRKIKCVGVGDDFCRYEYDSIEGGRTTYDTDKSMECEEFVDFLMGYMEMPTESPSASYSQGKEISKKVK